MPLARGGRAARARARSAVLVPALAADTARGLDVRGVRALREVLHGVVVAGVPARRAVHPLLRDAVDEGQLLADGRVGLDGLGRMHHEVVALLVALEVPRDAALLELRHLARRGVVGRMVELACWHRDIVRELQEGLGVRDLDSDDDG